MLVGKEIAVETALNVQNQMINCGEQPSTLYQCAKSATQSLMRAY